MEMQIMIRGAQCSQAKEGAIIILNLPAMDPEVQRMLRDHFPHTQPQIERLVMTEALIERIDA